MLEQLIIDRLHRGSGFEEVGIASIGKVIPIRVYKLGRLSSAVGVPCLANSSDGSLSLRVFPPAT